MASAERVVSLLPSATEIVAGLGCASRLVGVVVGAKGVLYVADGYNDRIQTFAAHGGFLGKWGGPFAMNIWGPFRGWFATVTALAVDAAGNVFAADFYNNRVQKFSASGSFRTAFGEEGSGPGRMAFAMGVAVAGDGSVFVTDFANNRVTKWRPPGGD